MTKGRIWSLDCPVKKTAFRKIKSIICGKEEFINRNALKRLTI